MKKVALIRNSYSYDFGGAEIFPINLAKILSNNNFEVSVLSSNEKTLTAVKNKEINTQKSPWWSRQNFKSRNALYFPFYLAWSAFVAVWYLVFFMRNHIDVVHPQSRDDFISATIAAKILRKRVIWTDHADLKHVYMNRVWYKNPVGKLVYFVSKYADAITIISNSEKELIEESLGKKLPNNYLVMHLGAIDKYISYKKTRNGIVFIATSRLVAEKGISELIQAFNMIKKPDVYLKICGDGPDATNFTKQASDNINIKFMGHIDNVVDELLDSDIFVHPTYHEGFGLSVVEAEMCGLPIIASNVGSIPEIVLDNINGILVKPKDSKSLFEAMNILVSDSKKREIMGKKSREIFIDRFQLDKIVKEKIIPLYEE